jgi:hypothetical protein
MVTLEGRITGVMETWPLQLIVAAGSQQHTVALSDTTEVKRNGVVVGPGALRPGQLIAVQGRREPPAGFVASAIVIRIA